MRRPKGSHLKLAGHGVVREDQLAQRAVVIARGDVAIGVDRRAPRVLKCVRRAPSVVGELPGLAVAGNGAPSGFVSLSGLCHKENKERVPSAIFTEGFSAAQWSGLGGLPR